jgi:hypothetical protein
VIRGSPSQQLQAFVTGLPSPWATFNKYAYNHNSPRNPPQCPNRVDEAHGCGGPRTSPSSAT